MPIAQAVINALRKHWWGVVLFGLAAWVTFASHPARQENLGEAPAFALNSIEGDKLTPAGLRGKVYLVNFWATTCSICVEEMPQVVATYRKFHDRGFETVAIAMQYDPPNRVVDFARARHLPFTVAYDANGDVARMFGDINATPTSFLIDRNGRILRRYLGAPDFERLHQSIAQALGPA